GSPLGARPGHRLLILRLLPPLLHLFLACRTPHCPPLVRTISQFPLHLRTLFRLRPRSSQIGQGLTGRPSHHSLRGSHFLHPPLYLPGPHSKPCSTNASTLLHPSFG